MENQETQKEEANLFSKIDRKIKDDAEDYCFRSKRAGKLETEHLYQLIEKSLTEYMLNHPIPTQG